VADPGVRKGLRQAWEASGLAARTAGSGRAGPVPEGPAQTSVARCTEAVRQMILSGELLPGETIRPARLAGLLGMSRIPVREALTALQAEGVVTYTPRIGHAVARFSPAEFAQVYLMRRLLEAELLASADLAAADVELLVQLNKELAELHAGPSDAASGWLAERKRLNREFHFHLLGLSPHALILAEVERLWNISELYRTLYAYEPRTQQRIVAEHELIIDAVRAGSRERLLAAADQHRGSAETAVLRTLGVPDHGHDPEGGC
jgi:DNA-binding GntR family transcriptional regulator